MKRIIFILLLSLEVTFLSAQNVLSFATEPLKIDMDKVNKLDSCLLKDGLWVDGDEVFIRMIYYKHGKKDGTASPDLYPLPPGR